MARVVLVTVAVGVVVVGLLVFTGNPSRGTRGAARAAEPLETRPDLVSLERRVRVLERSVGTLTRLLQLAAVGRAEVTETDAGVESDSCSTSFVDDPLFEVAVRDIIDRTSSQEEPLPWTPASDRSNGADSRALASEPEAVAGQPTGDPSLGAWQALGEADYTRALRVTEECIASFGDAAARQQLNLNRTEAPIPPIGEVTRDEGRDIMSRQSLNIAAACYLIRGDAADRLQQTALAQQAWSAAVDLPHARVWDPAGFFWSPAEAAQDRLAER